MVIGGGAVICSKVVGSPLVLGNGLVGCSEGVWLFGVVDYGEVSVGVGGCTGFKDETATKSFVLVVHGKTR